MVILCRLESVLPQLIWVEAEQQVHVHRNSPPAAPLPCHIADPKEPQR